MPFPLFALRVFGLGRRDAPTVFIVFLIVVAILCGVWYVSSRSNKPTGQ